MSAKPRSLPSLEFDQDGRFVLRFPPAFELGGHTVMVEQETDEGLLREVTTFRLTVQNFELEENRDKR